MPLVGHNALELAHDGQHIPRTVTIRRGAGHVTFPHSMFEQLSVQTPPHPTSQQIIEPLQLFTSITLQLDSQLPTVELLIGGHSPTTPENSKEKQPNKATL